MANILVAMPGKKEIPSLSVTHPELAEEADGWDPNLYTKGSSRKMSWKCKLSHIYLMPICKRTGTRRSGCPYCSNRLVLAGFNDLQTTHPELAKEADGWLPSQVISGSEKKFRWICPKSHKFEASIVMRSRQQTGCPYCSGRKVLTGFNDLLTTHPLIAQEALGWNPEEFSAGSNEVKSWVCSQNHIFNASIVNRCRKSGSGCPYCTRYKCLSGFNDLQTTHPELAKEADGWNPSEVLSGSDKKFSWKCSVGHKYLASPNNRTNMKSGCPYCSNLRVLVGFNDLQTTHPELAKEADGWDPRKKIGGSSSKVRWRCAEGHSYTATLGARTTNSSGCPSCAKSGYDQNKPGYLYFLEHLDWGMYQIGISNVPKKRLAFHSNLGWKTVEVRGPLDGIVARNWEAAILNMLRNSGADLKNDKNSGKFNGYSEAWSKSTFEVGSIKELMTLTEEFEVNQ